jgi:hypothetical protein
VKIAITLDRRTVNKQGKHPIKLRFTEGTKQIYHATGLFASIDEFSPETLFTGIDKRAKRMNDMLTDERERAEQLFADCRHKGVMLSP